MKEYLENCIRKASIWQKKASNDYENNPTLANLATLQAYGAIISNLENKLKENEK